MNLLRQIEDVKSVFLRGPTYVSSNKMKGSIRDLYMKGWVPISLEFKKRHGQGSYDEIEEALSKLYEYSRRHHIQKDKVMAVIRTVIPLLERIEIESIRNGSSIEPGTRESLRRVLGEKGFSRATGYVDKAETEFSDGKYDETCIQSRIAIEEVFRQARELHSGRAVRRGTLPNHLDYFKKEGLISEAEEKLLRYGFYGFLSEKGNHATLESVSREDAQLTLSLLYSLTQYVLVKVGL